MGWDAYIPTHVSFASSYFSICISLFPLLLRCSNRREVSGAIARFSAIVQPPLCTVGLKMDGPDRAPHPYRTFCKKTARLSLSFYVLVLGLNFLSLCIVPLFSPSKKIYSHQYPGVKIYSRLKSGVKILVMLKTKDLLTSIIRVKNLLMPKVRSENFTHA